MADTDVIPPVEADVDMKDEPGPGGDAEVNEKSSNGEIKVEPEPEPEPEILGPPNGLEKKIIKQMEVWQQLFDYYFSLTSFMNFVAGNINCIGGVMVSMLVSSVPVDRGFDPWLAQIKYYEIGICNFSTKHPTLRSWIKKTDWLRIRIVFLSGATCLPADCCFTSVIKHYKKSNLAY